jgi:hypothetical protein
MKIKILYDSLFALQDNNLNNAHAIKDTYDKDKKLITLHLSKSIFVAHFTNLSFFIDFSIKINNYDETKYHKKR